MRRIWSLLCIIGMVALTSCASTSGTSYHLGDTIVIGVNAELSGWASGYGTSMADGARYAAEEINKAGGVRGRSIEIKVVDNHSSATTAMTMTTHLMTQARAIAVIGPAVDDVFVDCPRVADTKQLPLIAATATNSTVTIDDNGNPHPFVFRTGYSDEQQATALAIWAQEQGISSAAVLVNPNDKMGPGLASHFTKAFSTNGTITGQIPYSPGQENHDEQVAAVTAASPGAVFIGGYVGEAGPLVAALREAGVSVPILGVMTMTHPEFMSMAGGAPSGLFITTPWTANHDDDHTTAFVSGYTEYLQASWKEKHPDSTDEPPAYIPNPYSAAGYNAVYVIANGLRGLSTPTGVDLRDALVDTSGFKKVLGLPVTFDDEHNNTADVVVMEYRDGHPVDGETIRLPSSEATNGPS